MNWGACVNVCVASREYAVVKTRRWRDGTLARAPAEPDGAGQMPYTCPDNPFYRRQEAL